MFVINGKAVYMRNEAVDAAEPKDIFFSEDTRPSYINIPSELSTQADPGGDAMEPEIPSGYKSSESEGTKMPIWMV